MSTAAAIRVMLPHQLCMLANVTREVCVTVDGAVTQRSVLDALETEYPMLRGTIREHDTGKRRPKVRIFACNEDISHDAPEAPLPAVIASGSEPLFVLGAISGG